MIFMAWLITYGVVYRLSEYLSQLIGIKHIVTAISMMLYWFVLFRYLHRNNCDATYYICFPQRKGASRYRIYVPFLLMPIMNAVIVINKYCSVNADTLLVFRFLVDFLTAVGCVIGEEVLFRGFLLVSMMRRSKTSDLRAIIVTSIIFSGMHIVNLLSGETLYDTLVQMLNAASVGFCLAVISRLEHSIFPCIVIHSLINISSLHIDDRNLYTAGTDRNAVFILLPILYILYGSYLYWKGEDRKRI